MPLFYQHHINHHTKLALWKIEEPEAFFSTEVPLQRDITHPHKRLQHLAGRYLLKFLFPDFPHEEIEVATTRKPFLPNEQYHFSISHCGDYAAAIVSRTGRVGVDVEMITKRVERIKNKFLHPQELQFVNSQLASQQLELLTVLWSAKEAMFKWYSYGEVDFSEMLRVMPFKIQEQGVMPAAILKGDLQVQLDLEYKVFKDLCLVYAVTAAAN